MTFKETILNIYDVLKGLSPSIWSAWLVVGILILLIVIVNLKIKHRDPSKPSQGIVLLAEILVDWVNHFCEEIMGSRWKKYAPYILTLGMFIFFSNITGLLGFHPPTANICITVALGIITASIIQGTCIKTQGFKNWLKGFISPSPIMLPLNIISEIVTPFSLGLRLFGNILSGVIIMGLMYFALGELWIHIASISIPIGYILTPIVTPLFHAVFDVFFGAIQTYVFMLLSTVFIAGKFPEED